MDPLTLIIIVLLVFALTGGGWYGSRADWGTPQYGSLLGLLLILLLVYLLLGHRIR